MVLQFTNLNSILLVDVLSPEGLLHEVPQLVEAERCVVPGVLSEGVPHVQSAEGFSAGNGEQLTKLTEWEYFD